MGDSSSIGKQISLKSLSMCNAQPDYNTGCILCDESKMFPIDVIVSLIKLNESLPVISNRKFRDNVSLQLPPLLRR